MKTTERMAAGTVLRRLLIVTAVPAAFGMPGTGRNGQRRCHHRQRAGQSVAPTRDRRLREHSAARWT